MNTEYTIKNFRLFDESGVSLNIKPLTILTGCNSSGKSSVVKSMVLMNQYLHAIRKDFVVQKDLDFTTEQTASLGNIQRVFHRGSEKKEITIGYRIHSKLLGEDVNVSFSFGPWKKDVLQQGHLKEMTICKLTGDVIYSCKYSEFTADFNLIKDNFYRFALGSYLLGTYCVEKNTVKIINKVKDTLSNNNKSIPDHFNAIRNYARLKNLFYQVYGEQSMADIIDWYANDTKKIDKLVLDNSDALEMSIRENALYCFPALKGLQSVKKGCFESYVKDVINGESLTDEEQSILMKIVKKFDESNCETFGEYLEWRERVLLQVKGFLESDCDTLNGPILYKEPINNVVIERWEEYGDYETYGFLRTINYLHDKTNSKLYNNYLPYEYPDGMVSDDRPLYYGMLKFVSHYVCKMFENYINIVMGEIVASLPSNISYIPTSVINVKRVYFLDAKDAFTDLLKRYLKVPVRRHPFIDKWIKELGIGERVSFDKGTINGVDYVSIHLHKNNDDEEGSILAEHGYGVTQLVAILIRIEIAIVESENQRGNDKNIYHWVNKEKQLDSDFHNYCSKEPKPLTQGVTTIAIEEPEVHLHPKFQSRLADMFYEAYSKYNIHFIIETHSEYLIRKSQVLVANMDYESNDDTDRKCPFQVYYFKENGEPYSLRYRKDGKFREKFGKGFYDEAANLAFEIL